MMDVHFLCWTLRPFLLWSANQHQAMIFSEARKMASNIDDDVLVQSSEESCTYTLFQLVNHSSSMTVVECFIGLLVFTIFMEVSISNFKERKNKRKLPCSWLIGLKTNSSHISTIFSLSYVLKLLLEKLEDIVQGTVVQEVLEKLYKVTVFFLPIVVHTRETIYPSLFCPPPILPTICPPLSHHRSWWF